MIINRSNVLFVSLLLLAVVRPLESLVLSHYGIETEYIRYILSLCVSILLIAYIFKKRKSDYKGRSFVYVSLILWSCVIFVNSISDINATPLNLKLFLSNSLPLLLLPFLINYEFTIKRIKDLVKTFSILVPFLILIIIFYPFILYERNGVSIEYFSYAFATPVGFLAMFASYGKKAKKLLLYCILLLVFIIPCIYLGRRAATLYVLYFLLSAFIFNLPPSQKNLSNPSIRNRVITLFLILLISIVLLLVYGEYTTYIIERFATGFDSRQNPMEDFIDDFNRSQDWLFGRGVLGMIYAGGLGSDDWGMRRGIESGWLNLVLHGGIPYALIILSLCLESIISSLKSSNKLCKILGLYIFYSMIDMIGFGVQFVNLKTVMFYIAISCLHSSSILKMSNDDIKMHISKFV